MGLLDQCWSYFGSKYNFEDKYCTFRFFKPQETLQELLKTANKVRKDLQGKFICLKTHTNEGIQIYKR
jgi:hypothetical protein